VRCQFTMLFAIVYLSLKAVPGNGDTTFIKRPYYLVFSVAYTDFLKSAEIGSGFPVGQASTAKDAFYKFYNSRSAGLMIAFPFFRKWECELGSDMVITKDWRHYNVWHVVPNTAPPEYYATTISRLNNVTSVRVRSAFSYEFLRKEKFACHAAGGAWYDSRGTAGFVGMEGGVKLYYTPVKSVAVQFAANYGVTKGGKYFTFRLGIALCGSRNYRAKPDKYYIRTYED